MKKLNTLLVVLLAALIGKFALANRHEFAEPNAQSIDPAPIEQVAQTKFETATFALG